MKQGFRGLTGKNASCALSLLIIALLLFPSSPSVLCIAPGNHVAIEDINAPCCLTSVMPAQPGNSQGGEYYKSDGCNNCTDLLLGANESGALPQLAKFVTSGQVDAECLATCLPAKDSSSPCRSGVPGRTDSPIPASASVPLRC